MQIRYPQALRGVPVEAAGVSVAILKTNLGVFHSDLVKVAAAFFPGVSLSTEAKLTSDDAVAIADRVWRSSRYFPFRSPSDPMLQHPPELVIFPIPSLPDAGEHRYHLVWKVDFPMVSGIRIDAQTGDVITNGSGPSYYQLQANVYGALTSEGKYDEGMDGTGNLRRSVGSLPYLSLWKSSGPGLAASLPPATDGNGAFLPGIPEDDFFPVLVQLNGPSLPWLDPNGVERVKVPAVKVFDDAGPSTPAYDEEEFSRELEQTDFPVVSPYVDPVFIFSSPVAGDVSNAHNVYYQIRRGLLTYFGPQGITVKGVGATEVDPGTIEVRANYEEPGSWSGSTIGAAGDGKIRLRRTAGESSDAMLHELSHLAVLSKHDVTIEDPLMPIDQKDLSRGVDEGLANYFACRINKDSEYDLASGATYNLLVKHVLEDCNGNQSINAVDWQHYGNGRVLASILWDLTKGNTPGHTTDKQMWDALQPEPDGIVGYRFEDLYTALKNNGSNPDLLWSSFSAHGVNLYASPRLQAPLAVTTVDLNWSDYLGVPATTVAYVIERQELGPLPPPAPVYIYPPAGSESAFTNGVSDLEYPVEPGKTHQYRVSPFLPPLAEEWSNEVQGTVSGTQMPYGGITDLGVKLDPSVAVSKGLSLPSFDLLMARDSAYSTPMNEGSRP